MHIAKRPAIIVALVLVIAALGAGGWWLVAGRGDDQPVQLQSERAVARVGPKPVYLALGDSLAYGTQPNFDITNGYADQLAAQLRPLGTQQLINFACPGETSETMLKGGCRLRFFAKNRYQGSQLDQAVAFIEQNRGNVSPVTLTIGANDVIDDLDPRCNDNAAAFNRHLGTMRQNLDVIVSRLSAALAGEGDLIVTTYYNPFAQSCPKTAPYLSNLNEAIRTVAGRYEAVVADMSSLFGDKTCDYTWICSRSRDIHATTEGYARMAGQILSVALPPQTNQRRRTSP